MDAQLYIEHKTSRNCHIGCGSREKTAKKVRHGVTGNWAELSILISSTALNEVNIGQLVEKHLPKKCRWPRVVYGLSGAENSGKR